MTDKHQILLIELRLAYRDSGLSLAQAAARAGVSPNTMYRVFHGEDVRLSTLMQIASAFNRTIALPSAS